MADRKIHPNSLANLKPAWSATNQPKGKKGPKPSSVKKFIKDNGLNYNDISQLAKHILPLTQEQLQNEAVSKKTPLIIRLFALSVLKDLKAGKIDNIMRIIDRAVGKPKEHVENTNKNVSASFNIEVGSMSEEEAKQLFFATQNQAEEE